MTLDYREAIQSMMKAQQEITADWGGEATAEEIAELVGRSYVTVRHVLADHRSSGKIRARRARFNSGTLGYLYSLKDVYTVLSDQGGSI